MTGATVPAVGTNGAGVTVEGVAAIDVLRTLAEQRHGTGDPSTVVRGTAASGEFARATWTPDGAGTIHLTWAAGRVTAHTWGPGGTWLAARVRHLVGLEDRPLPLQGPHQAVTEAQRRQPGHRIGSGGGLYHTLLPVVLGQRVTSAEARRSWRMLVLRYGEPAPGPGPSGVRLPPGPERLARLPYWALHELGVERSRAAILIGLARRADALFSLEALAPDLGAARRLLAALPGIGAWTIGCTLGPAFGDPDAVAVGDYWLKHIVCRALAGEARGTDERMLELLAPYAGQRGRAVALVRASGWRAPRRAPGQRVLPISRW
jgi:3-methyladenine DNA glycosylase/8-oxoguanine DNA glycosylase